MGRGRSSTNYSDAEKQLLLRAVAAVKPRRAGCWQLVESHYNARRGAGDARVVERDAHSLKRKFKTMATAKPTEYDDPYNARARELMARVKARAAAIANGHELDEDDENDENDEETLNESTTAAPYRPQQDEAPQGHNGLQAAPSTTTTSYAVRGVPSLAPLLPGPPPQAPTPPPSASTSAVPRLVGTGDGSLGSDLAQLLLVIREENALREAARRQERDEAIAREQRWRDEARELRRQEREEAAAREDRYRRELAEQRRRDRDEAAARHEQMMVLLATLLKAADGPRGALDRLAATGSAAQSGHNSSRSDA